MSLQKIFTEKEKQDIIYKYTIQKMGSKKIGQIYKICSKTYLSLFIICPYPKKWSGNG